jgi:hypothetical protein
LTNDPEHIYPRSFLASENIHTRYTVSGFYKPSLIGINGLRRLSMVAKPSAPQRLIRVGSSAVSISSPRESSRRFWIARARSIVPSRSHSRSTRNSTHCCRLRGQLMLPRMLLRGPTERRMNRRGICQLSCAIHHHSSAVVSRPATSQLWMIPWHCWAFSMWTRPRTISPFQS